MLELVSQSRNLAHRKFMEALCPFYRLNKYEGNLPINRADARGAVFVRTKLFYNRIPKNANTTIVSVISQLEHGDGDAADGARAKKALIRPSELGSREVRALEESFFKFVFTRNPYTRVLSAYLDKIARGRRQAEKFHRWARRKEGTGDPSFGNFCRYLAENGLYEDPHWATQKDSLLLCTSKFDFIGSVENLGADLREILLRAFHGESTVDVPVTNSTNSSAKVAAFYTQREVALVRDLYKEDFEAFGYSTAFPPD